MREPDSPSIPATEPELPKWAWCLRTYEKKDIQVQALSIAEVVPSTLPPVQGYMCSPSPGTVGGTADLYWVRRRALDGTSER